MKTENTKKQYRLSSYPAFFDKANTVIIISPKVDDNSINFNQAIEQKDSVVNNIINVHPVADPRSPRSSISIQDEEKPIKKQWKCCWPFSLCCGSRPRHHKEDTRIDFDAEQKNNSQLSMNRHS